MSDMNCDVIGFQEVFSTNALKNLVEEIGFTHFTTVESPVTDINEPLVFIKPVVAIASKYPILSVSPLKVPDSITEEIPLGKTFRFSRIPIKATIRIDSSRDIGCYVSHLKSKKPAMKDIVYNPSEMTLIFKNHTNLTLWVNFAHVDRGCAGSVWRKVGWYPLGSGETKSVRTGSTKGNFYCFPAQI
ncbi:hypothetical protein P4J23_25995 [Bacillus cereus]|nr:hypothetical protein [Bacillus cereus]